MRSFITCTLLTYLLLFEMLILYSACQRIAYFIYGTRRFITVFTEAHQSRDSSVGVALGYRLDDQSYRVRFPAGAGNFSLHHCVQNVSGAHPASCPMGTRGSFLGGEAAGA
jgi:hypothetical protein